MKATTMSVILLITIGICISILFIFTSPYFEMSQPIAESGVWGDCVDRGECLAPYEAGGLHKNDKIYADGVDITGEYQNKSLDSNRECNAQDRYSSYGKYLCIKSTTETNNPSHISRGADRKAITYTYTFIYNLKEIPELKENHAYSATFLEPLGYCHGEGMITSVVDLGVSCNGGSSCHGFVIGWGNETRNEVCEG